MIRITSNRPFLPIPPRARPLSYRERKYLAFFREGFHTAATACSRMVNEAEVYNALSRAREIERVSR